MLSFILNLKRITTIEKNKIKRRHSECITHSYTCIDRKLSRLLGFSQKIIGLIFFFTTPKYTICNENPANDRNNSEFNLRSK